MKKLAVFIYLIVLSVNAQDVAPVEIAHHVNPSQIKTADRKSKPIGLDLMGGTKNGVTVFPTQDNDHILISVSGKQIDKRSIRIADLNGQPVFRMENRHENTFLVDSSGLSKGIYIIEVISGNAVYRKKWAKS